MLTLARVGAWIERDRARHPVWTPALGAARTLLALGTAVAVGLTDHRRVFAPSLGSAEGPTCDGGAAVSLFCLPGAPVGALRVIAVLVLLLVATGWRPRWTALPHWYVSWSLLVSATLTDGGDQITVVLTSLLLPVCLADQRRWHWQRRAPDDRDAPWREAVPVASRAAIRVQLALVYFQASVSKLGVPEWVDGTATYYWLGDPTFGASGLIGRALTAASASWPIQLALTWLPLVVEFAIAVVVLFGSAGARRWAFRAGIAFHGAIAVAMGLISFSLAMAAALLLGLRWHQPAPAPAPRTPAATHAEPAVMGSAPA